MDASTTYSDVFSIYSAVEELIQVVTGVWQHLLPSGAVLSLSYNGGCGNDYNNSSTVHEEELFVLSVHIMSPCNCSTYTYVQEAIKELGMGNFL